MFAALWIPAFSRGPIMTGMKDIETILAEKYARMQYVLIPVDPEQEDIVGREAMMSAVAANAQALLAQILDDREHNMTEEEE